MRGRVENPDVNGDSRKLYAGSEELSCKSQSAEVEWGDVCFDTEAKRETGAKIMCGKTG